MPVCGGVNRARGEKLVKYACIMHGLLMLRPGGLGAVMARKTSRPSLSAAYPPPIKSPERVKEFREWLTANIEK